MQAKSLLKGFPQKVPPQLNSPTMIAGQGIWSIVRGGWGAGAGAQEIAHFWQRNGSSGSQDNSAPSWDVKVLLRRDKDIK